MKYLTIGAIVKNEAPYIEEWIEFHLLQGVEHFYICDNGSTDGTYEILEKYDGLGLITLFPLGTPAFQMKYYDHVVQSYRSRSKWIAFIDADEFLFHTQGSLSDALKEYEEYPGVAARWYLFGDRCNMVKEPLVTRKFQHRAAHPDQHVKSIVQPSRVKSVGKNPHVFYCDAPVVDENKKSLPKEYAVMPGRTADLFRINHYHVKTLEEYMLRKAAAPRADISVTLSNKQILEQFEAHNKNDVEDKLAMARFSHIVEHNIEVRINARNSIDNADWR